MDRKEEKMLGILRHKTKIYTVIMIYYLLIIKYQCCLLLNYYVIYVRFYYNQDMLTKNVDDTIDSTKILTKHWENILFKYHDTELHSRISASHILRILTHKSDL